MDLESENDTLKSVSEDQLRTIVNQDADLKKYRAVSHVLIQ